MNTFRLYLWKEWREQRTTLFALIGVLLLLVVLAGLFLPRFFFADPIVLGVCVSLGALSVLLMVGGEIVAAETAGKRRRFLERLPAGVDGAFRAKLFFFAALLAGGAGFGWLLGQLASLWRAGEPPGIGSGDIALLLLMPILVLGAWVFAVASWVPRGSLALPLAALVLLVAYGPFVYLYHVWGYNLLPWELLGSLLLNGAGAVAVAWLSFTTGRRFGRSSQRAALGGGGLGALFVLPVVAWAGVREASFVTVDPTSEGFSITWAWPCEDERHMLVSGVQQYPGLEVSVAAALVVDLETGDWRRIGPVGSGLTWRHDVRDALLCDRDREVLGAIDLEDGSVIPTGGQESEEWIPARSGRRLYDASRDAYYDAAVILPDLEPRDDLLIGPGVWVFRKRPANPGIEEALERPWSRYDPDTDERTPLDWPDDDTALRKWCLPDGRIPLVFGGELYLGDPNDGSLVPVAVEGEFSGLLMREWPWDYRPSSASDPVIVMDGERLFRFDLEAPALVRLPLHYRDGRIVWVEDERTLILVEYRNRNYLDGYRVVRVDLTTGERTALFPAE